MYDLIAMGSISIDMYFQGDSLTNDGNRFNLAIGGKYQVDHFYAGLGGGAANVAIGVQKHGFKAAVMGKIGNNQFKQLILKHLKNHNIPVDLCQEERDYMKISSIFLSPSGERTIIHYETPHEHIIKSHKDLTLLDYTKIIYVSNLWRVPLDERRHILSYAESRKIVTIMNLGVADCRRPIEQINSLLQHTHILIVNTYEFAEIVKKPLQEIDFKKDISLLLPYMKEKIIVVTDGVRGSHAYVKGQTIYEAVMPVTKVLDTTGAGDAYSAGFIAGYLQKEDVKKGMQLGSKWASKIIQKIGAN